MARDAGIDNELMMNDRIVSTPDVRFDKPRVRGIRIAVIDILEYTAGGDSVDVLFDE